MVNRIVFENEITLWWQEEEFKKQNKHSHFIDRFGGFYQPSRSIIFFCNYALIKH